MATNESGTEPQDLFQFNIRARHAVTLEVREFEMEAGEYRDGEVVELELTGFMKVAEGPVYLVTVSCTNRFGMSEGSDSQTVSIRFSAGKVPMVIVLHAEFQTPLSMYMASNVQSAVVWLGYQL